MGAKERYLFCFQEGVSGYLVNGVMPFYLDCEIAVSVDGELSSSFSVRVGVHQESALSPLLFIMVIDVLTGDVKGDSLIELNYLGRKVVFRKWIQK